MKTSVPDGKGGFKEIDGAEFTPKGKIDQAKRQETDRKQFIEDAGNVTESLLKFDFALIKERGLTKEHRVFAAALYCVNLRDSYPDGTKAFDEIAMEAAEYYDKNAPKKRA